jgi:uncharacterized membrane protein
MMALGLEGVAMPHFHILAGAENVHTQPKVRHIDLGDIRDALARGIDDFMAMPSHAIFLCLIYPMVGLLAAAVAFGQGLMQLLYPLVAGFALVGPLAALGLYELSRQREQGRTPDWSDAFDLFRLPSFGSIVVLGLLLTAIFLVWLGIAQAIYVANFGDEAARTMSVGDFLHRVVTTPEGWRVILWGNVVGFLIALAVLTISVVSFPLLLDRDVGVAEAVLTSYRAVKENPATMAVWGLIVAAALLLGSLPLFVGLAVVVPVLGHATWHLYRRLVEPEPSLQQELPPAAQHPRRYAAQFPASLFAGEKND